jgi:hypothetical protein
MCHFLMNALGLLRSKFHLILTTKVVWDVVEITLTKIHPNCISVPRTTAESVQFGLQQKQLGRTSVLEFFGHVNVGIGPRVEYQCWSSLNFALADQKRELFLLLGKCLCVATGIQIFIGQYT